MELSKRLQAVADLVSNGVTVADVGTDHGYIPIYLVESGKSKCAIAMDINRGPLDRAEAHIRMHGLGEQIKTRLSDGVKKLQIGECDCVIVAGMGGGLVIKIMEDGEEIFRNLTEFILQPQSEIAKVRQYLCEHNYRIIAEDMVLEDGKFYPMMKVMNRSAEEYSTLELRYGKLLLREKHPVLKLFLEKEEKTKEQICRQLRKEEGIHIASRIAELENETAQTKEALGIY
ncbi:MAG: SAM-dependent methyltransferase [Clostridiales bacterium]|nr:SAM-dependent methyltransferase [Clostridiales bacterium]